MAHTAGPRAFPSRCIAVCLLVLVGCQSAASHNDASTETSVDTGAPLAETGGGVLRSGGALSTGGDTGSAGAPAAGGTTGQAGAPATGGVLGAGGSPATGGNLGSGGSLVTGGRLGSAGALAPGGVAGVGGTGGTGGSKTAPDASSDSASCTGWSTLVHLTPQQLKDLLAAQDIYLVNVVSQKAPNIAGTDLDLQTGTDATPTVTAIENLVNHNTCADIVIYCVTGNTSQRVATQLIGDGYLRVRDLQGGITAWQAQGFPVVQVDGGSSH